MSFAVCLIALCFGYLVFVAAGKEEGGLKLLGQVIGIAVMILALLAGVCSATKCDKFGYGKKTCSIKAAGLNKQCPLSNS